MSSREGKFHISAVLIIFTGSSGGVIDLSTLVVWNRYDVILTLEPERSTGQLRLFLGRHIAGEAPLAELGVKMGATAIEDVQRWDADKIPCAFGKLLPVPIPNGVPPVKWSTNWDRNISF